MRRVGKLTCVCVLSHSVVSDSLGPHGLQLTRLLFPQDSPGENTGVGYHFLLQGIFLIQRVNLWLLVSCILGRFSTFQGTFKIFFQKYPNFFDCIFLSLKNLENVLPYVFVYKLCILISYRYYKILVNLEIQMPK